VLTQLGNKRKSQEFESNRGQRKTYSYSDGQKKNCSFSLFPCLCKKERRRNNNKESNSAQKIIVENPEARKSCYVEAEKQVSMVEEMNLNKTPRFFVN